MRVDTPDGRGGAANDKRALRVRMRAMRRRLREDIPDAGERLAAACVDAPALRNARVVALYRAMHDEIDVDPLARRLRGRGHALAYPAVRLGVMRFVAWDVDGAFAPDDCGAPAPPTDAPAAAPDFVVAPLLAFDLHGGRLGYGGGWYDRALWALKRTNPHLKVYGAAFAGQKLDYTPRQPHDFPLDGVFMELGAVQTAS